MSYVYLLCENECEEEEEGSLAFFFDEWILSDEKENKKTKLYQKSTNKSIGSIAIRNSFYSCGFAYK